MGRQFPDGQRAETVCFFVGEWPVTIKAKFSTWFQKVAIWEQSQSLWSSACPGHIEDIAIANK